MYRFYYLYLTSILCCNSPNKHIVIILKDGQADLPDIGKNYSAPIPVIRISNNVVVKSSA